MPPDPDDDDDDNGGHRTIETTGEYRPARGPLETTGIYHVPNEDD